MADRTSLEGAASAEFNSARQGPGLDDEWDRVCADRLGLRLINKEMKLWGGRCPFCRHSSAFFVWLVKLRFRCFNCNVEGRIR